MLELTEVSKRYQSGGEEITALDALSLEVQPAEFVAVLGPSGSGKTTLLLLAAGLLMPDSGRVSFEGEDLAALQRAQLLDYRRRQLGFVFQNFNLVAGLSAEENVALPLLLRGTPHDKARELARGSLADVGLAERAESTSGQMSGGEQQRVCLARALVGDPRLVLADEPTGNLDSERGEQVVELLRDLARRHQAAVVLVTHDPRMAHSADRKLLMRDGRLVDEAADRPAP